jgi:TPR repeat protein
LLGQAYEQGHGVSQDYSVAAHWYGMAAAQGNACGQVYLGALYEHTWFSDDSDMFPETKQYDGMAKVLFLYGKAAAQGDSDAEYGLANLYAVGTRELVWNGQQFKIRYQSPSGADIADAANLYRKAAEQGHAAAQFALGEMYYNGKGVPLSYSEALKWHQKAAEQGFMGSQIALGDIYANGDGVKRDKVQAYMWFNLAAAQGSANALQSRDRIAGAMTRGDVLKAQQLANAWQSKRTSGR